MPSLRMPTRTQFDIVSVVVAGAYFMSRQVLDKLGHPRERRHSAGVEEFAEEFGTGVRDPVIAR